MKIQKGDTVLVTKGTDRGKTGVVTAVSSYRETIVVKGVNIQTRHVKPRLRNAKGVLEKKEMPIARSNVSFIDPKSKKRVRIGYTGRGKEKRRIMHCKGEAVPVPMKKKPAKKKTGKGVAKKIAAEKKKKDSKRKT